MGLLKIHSSFQEVWKGVAFSSWDTHVCVMLKLQPPFCDYEGKHQERKISSPSMLSWILGISDLLWISWCVRHKSPCHLNRFFLWLNHRLNRAEVRPGRFCPGLLTGRQLDRVV
jgi:hypothetical protein